MKMKFKTFVFAFLLIMLIGIGSAETNPTQQSNKIFLNPFYTPSMSQNTNVTFSVNVNPPDKISSVLSAIISFDIYITPTVTFNLWVNGQPCNNPTYVISTTFASAGQSRVTFDCSNIIKQAGNYIVTIRPTQANTGAVSGWLDLTYLNNPKGLLALSGTEYSPSDPATIFTQLKDSQGVPVTNGSCYLDIFYPLNSSGSHPYTVKDAPMLAQSGDDGIYYYDLTAPSTLGVYMLSARCAYTYNQVFVYRPDELILKPVISTGVTGTWIGDSLSLNRFDGNIFECDVAGGGAGCVANFTFNTTAYGTVNNITNINVFYAGQIKGSASNDWTLTLAYWNGTRFINMTNTLLLQHQALAPNAPDQFLSNVINSSAIVNGIVTLQYSLKLGTGTGTQVFNDWLALSLLTSTGIIQDVKGSSEMHITNKANVTATATVNSTDIANQVWNATSRNLTDYNGVWNYNGTVNSNLISQFVNAIWNYSNGIASNILTQISNTVWNAGNRNLTFYPNVTTQIVNVTTQVVSVQNITLNLTTQNVTVQNVTVNVTTQQVNVQNITNNITTQIVNVTNVNVTTQVVSVQNITNNITTQIVSVENVTLNVTLNTTTVNVQNVTVNVNSTSVNLNDVQNAVWNATDRNLTDYNGVWNYIGTVNSNLISQFVNATDIANEVWNYNGTVSNNILIQIWNFAGSISSNILTQIANTIWNHTDRNLTFYPNVTTQVVNVQNVTNNITTQTVNVNNVSINSDDIAGSVWNYSARYIHGELAG